MPSTDLTAGAVVERDGEFLIVEERVGVDLVLTQPGGHLERGEAAAEAAARETLEETGFRIVTRELLDVYLWTDPQAGRRFLRIMYVGELLACKPRPALDDGIARVCWLDADALRARRERLRTPVVLRAVEDYLCGRRRSAEGLAALTSSAQDLPALLAAASPV